MKRKPWAPDDLLVRAPHKHRRILVMSVMPFIVGMAAVVALSLDGDGNHWYGFAAGPVFGLLIAWSSTNTLARFRAYRDGWLEGRAAMIAALIEAGKRRLTVAEWMQAQAEQDAALMGVPTIVFKDEVD